VIIVIDSSIWISAIEFGGTPAAALDRALQVEHLATCADIDDEVIRILSRKFSRDPEAARHRLQTSLGDALRIEITGEVAGVCRDPNDDCILECALKAGAQFIVTGDNDLLVLSEFQSIRIITARQYLEISASA
jgi:putative PIN family toxin of toxin-antitoxin system